ncbi:MAG: tyrosine-type recombinase/integrase [Gemmatimonadetes bacterium]|nr:tyrosine-type recombinase/integrase [Gemmatimonadota bacterium]MBT5327665.1 tyrosine-type recombinase/integrase [Gemmatimonadota bacterium]MBT5449811.1 tyrosine-type recombinase/integrase [Gemmatimonadota bacterium]MBT5800166.1 tyrosine-type recombinase/integrase [Gemmatimonadota bacterium]MBT6622370.1 tyrosine-type recombinase/integrase [Gemmatimonadota bacterium]
MRCQDKVIEGRDRPLIGRRRGIARTKSKGRGGETDGGQRLDGSRSCISAHWSVSVLGDSSKSTSAEKRIRAGIGHVRPHDLRHTCASLLIAEGLNIKQVSSHLRHSSVGVTLDTYGHLYPGDRNEVAHAMDRVLGIAKNG